MVAFSSCTILLLTLFILSVDVESKSTPVEVNLNNSLLGQGQSELASILDSLAGGKFKLYEPKDYNQNFRPPCVSSSAEQCPTVIKISLKRVEVKNLNDTKGGEALKIEAILVTEYQDSRLRFVFPPGYAKTYVRARYGGIDPLNIWQPDIRIPGDLGVFNDGNDALTLFNSEGQIYNQKPIGVDAKFVGYKDNLGENQGNLVFSLEIRSKWDFVDDILFEWGEDVGELSLNKNNKKVESMDGKREYEVRLGELVGSCHKKQIAKYGIMGEHETSCIELQIQVRPLPVESMAL